MYLENFYMLDGGIMKKELVFIKIDEWMTGFYNLPDIMPMFSEDFEQLKEQNAAYDFEKGFQAVKYFLETAENPDPRYELFVKKWPHMSRLSDLIEKKKFSEAAKILDLLLKVDDLDPSSHFHQGFVAKRTGNYKRSIKEYNRCIELCPDEGPDLGMIYTNLARTYLEIADRENAVKTFRRALEVLPGDVFILEELAAIKEVFPVYTDPNRLESLIYMEKDSYVKSMKRIIQECHEPEKLYQFANILFGDDLFDESFEAVEKFLETEQDDRRGRLLKCEIHRVRKEYDLAQGVIGDLLLSFPECPETCFVQSKILLESGKVDSGMEFLIKAMNLCPDFDDAVYLYYMILENEGRTGDAIEFIESLGNDYEESWVPFYEIACHYIRKNDLENSLEYLSRAYSRNPQSQKVLSALSGQLGNAGNHEDVIKILWEPYQQQLFTDHTLFWNLANALKASNEIIGAIEVLQNMMNTPGLNPIYYRTTNDEIEFLKSFL